MMSRFFLLILTVIISSSAIAKTTKSPLILLSIDGFAYDYLSKHQPQNILKFANSGVKAKLLSVYPSKTFPNHLSTITGVYPAKHGIVHNKFYHPQLKKKYSLGAGKNNDAWLTAKPFWSYAQEHGLKSAVYFWPESESKGQGSLPIYNIPYNNRDSIEQRFNQIIDWLALPADQAPQFIVSYFASIDNAGHEYGLDSPELKDAIGNFDQAFGRFLTRLKSEIPREVNIILLSDHGMVQIDPDKQIPSSLIFNKALLQLVADKAITIARSSTQLYFYFDNKKLTNLDKVTLINSLKTTQSKNNQLFDVYEKGDYPKHWHFNDSDAVVVPDLIIEAKLSASLYQGNYAHKTMATHGYDPKNVSGLTAIFIASGPDIVQGTQVAPFENIHIMPFMSEILSLPKPKNIDGNIKALQEVIK